MTDATTSPIGGRFAWERVLFSVLMTAAAGVVIAAAGAVIQSQKDVAVIQTQIADLKGAVNDLKADTKTLRDDVAAARRELVRLDQQNNRGRAAPARDPEPPPYYPPATYSPYAPPAAPPGPTFRPLEGSSR